MGKTWIAAAAVLVIVGAVVFTAAMTAVGWDFSKLNSAKYVTNTHAVTDDFSGIDLQVNTADVVFAVAEDGKCKVVCYEPENAKHAVSVANGTLTLRVKDERAWYEHIGFYFSAPKVTVFLPAGAYGDLLIEGHTGAVQLPKDFSFDSIAISESTGNITCHASAAGDVKIETSTGDVLLESISAENLIISTSTGNISVSDVQCRGNGTFRASTGNIRVTNMVCVNMLSTGSTGNIVLKNTVASQTITVSRSTGDVNFQDCDAGQLFVETDTGNVSGSLLTDKVFVTHSDTGSVRVPRTTTGGTCEITTDTGNIKITIAE